MGLIIPPLIVTLIANSMNDTNNYLRQKKMHPSDKVLKTGNDNY